MSLKSLDQVLNRFTFSEQYKTEEWKAFSRRMRDMQPSCEACRRAPPQVKLNVHHLVYDSERKLWDYERNEVVILCEGCHQSIHKHLQEFRKHIFGYLTPQAFVILNGALAAAAACRYDPLELAHAFAELISSPRSVRNFALSWNQKPKS